MIITVLTIVIIFGIISTLLTYTLFCYEETNRTGLSVTIFTKIALRAAFKSILSEIIIIILHPIGFLPRLWNKPHLEESPIVILVHGLFHNPSAWIMFRKWFHANGMDTACFRYESWGKSELRDTIDELKIYLQHIQEEYPERDIHLVGHSLGGLLLRAALSEQSNPKIKSLTTLGTPFNGSKLAPFSLQSLGRFIWYESTTIRNISNMPFPAKIQGLALWSQADNMVLPSSSLWCNIKGWENRQILDVSHIAMLHSRRVFAEVLNATKAAALN